MPRAQKGIGRQGKKHTRPATHDIHRHPKVQGTSAVPAATSKPVQESTAIEEEADQTELPETIKPYQIRPRYSPYVVARPWEPHPRYSDDTPLLPGYRIPLGEPPDPTGHEKWDPDQPPSIPSDERPAKVFGSVIAAEAVAAVWDLECVLPNQNPEDSDYEDYIGNQEEKEEVARIKYKHTLRRLAAEFPELMIPPELHAGLDASEQETRPCPCGAGRLARWPWVLQTVCLGFCPNSHKYIDWSKLGSYWDLKHGDAKGMCDWEMECWRQEWITAAPGGFRMLEDNFPDAAIRRERTQQC